MNLWEGRTKGSLDELAKEYNKSINFDKEMYREDIEGSLAHTKMLEKIGVITKEEYELLKNGLDSILNDIEDEKLEINLEDEDIHTFVEEVLTERIGDAGKKLHTGRSRNDQSATDVRLYLRNKSFEIEKSLIELIDTLIEKSKQNLNTLMPGYTHLQNAQVVTFAHHMMAYAQMFTRDLSRISETIERMNYCPLGSGALATTTYPLDRKFTASELKFTAPCENSMDAVSDRDHIAEINFDNSLIMAHLSRLSEELILWSSMEFSFVKISDSYTTGSSIMPQKKNPDMAELIRGKSGRVFGSLMSILTVIKGTPLSFNKDFQEDKEGTFDSIETTIASLKIMAGMIKTLEVNVERMKQASERGFLNATDMADYLVTKGIPFRDAYRLVGEIVNYAVCKDKKLEDISIEEYKKFDERFERDLYEHIDLKNCLDRRNVYGGPAPEAVKVQIKNLEEKLKIYK